ncbi:MAG: exodeoxyribonuclease VII small subunit [Phycisphaerales bacterium]
MPQEPTFEQAIQHLEGIIERIESGEAGLEQSIAEYERGVALIRRCRQVLDRAEQRVEELTAQMQASPVPPVAPPSATQGSPAGAPAPRPVPRTAPPESPF